MDGQFDDVQANFAFVIPTITYDLGGIRLVLEPNETNFSDVAKTANQSAVAEGVQSLGLGHPLYNAVISLDEETAALALDQLSGEIYAGVKGFLLAGSGYLADRLTDPPSPTTADGTSMQGLRAASLTAGGLTVWSGASGDDTTGLDGKTRGFFVGVESDSAGNADGPWQFGLAGGHTATTLDDRGRNDSASIDSVHLAGYGKRQWSAYDVRLGATHVMSDVGASREIAFSDYREEVSADYGASATQLFAAVSRSIDAGATEVEPYAEVAYALARSAAFSEKGGDAALNGGGSAQDVFLATVGLRGESRLNVRGAPVQVGAGLAWRQSLSDPSPSETLRIAGGGDFEVQSSPFLTSALIVNGGVGVALNDAAQLVLSYAGQFGNRADNDAVSLKMVFQF